MKKCLLGVLTLWEIFLTRHDTLLSCLVCYHAVKRAVAAKAEAMA